MTEFQSRLYRYIKFHIEELGYSPSIRDMASHMKCGMGMIYKNLDSLKKRRKITWNRNLWRGVEIK